MTKAFRRVLAAGTKVAQVAPVAVGVACLVCLVGTPAPAHADVSRGDSARSASNAKTAKARAIELFEQSARAYRDGRFQDAIDLLVEARRVKPEPVLLYNLGRAYEAMGRQTEAADAYASYLAEDPRAVDRRAIEGRVTTLRSQAEQLDKAKNPPSPPEERRLPPEPPPNEPQPAAQSEIPLFVPIVVTAVGVAGLGAGVAFGILSGSEHDAAVREPRQAAAQDNQDRAESFATGSTIALIAGGVVAAAGFTWLGIRLFVSPSSPSSGTAPPTSARTMNVIPGSGSLIIRGTF